jgi:hypothetical protein
VSRAALEVGFRWWGAREGCGTSSGAAARVMRRKAISADVATTTAASARARPFGKAQVIVDTGERYEVSPDCICPCVSIVGPVTFHGRRAAGGLALFGCARTSLLMKHTSDSWKPLLGAWMQQQRLAVCPEEHFAIGGRLRVQRDQRQEV